MMGTSETTILGSGIAPHRRLNVLSVEDNDDDIGLLRLAIQKAGSPVTLHVASDGEEAIEYLKETWSTKPSDLILLDLNMPRKDGRQTLTEIKQNEVLKLVPVLIFTTSNSEAHIQECYSLGAAFYLVKPVDFQELVSLVRKTFSFWLSAEPPPMKGELNP